MNVFSFSGNPFTGCNLPLQRCNSFCQCDESGQYCAESCSSDAQCSCGQVCANGKCRSRCNPGNCLEGQLCQDGACIAGCRNNLDCSGDRSCINGQCLDPCELDDTCGQNAICRVSEHRVVCLCPDGFRGEPTQGCTRSECSVDSDCEIDKRCEAGSCRNPCLQAGACGVNAQCRVVNRHKQCSCPPGHFGNPAIECSLETGACARNPCGANTRCRDVNGGYECSCAPGCEGEKKHFFILIAFYFNIWNIFLFMRRRSTQRLLMRRRMESRLCWSHLRAKCSLSCDQPKRSRMLLPTTLSQRRPIHRM